MSLNNFGGQFLTPGQLPELFTLEPSLTGIIWGRLEQQVIGHNVIIDGSARDTGNTGYTTSLRPGLLLGKITSGGDAGKFKQWNPAATDGSQFIAGVLLTAVAVQTNGVDVDRFIGYVLFGGLVKAYGLAIAADTDYGIIDKDEEYAIRNQMATNFRFDDDPMGYSVNNVRGFVAKTANYTVVDADAGLAFTTIGATGAVTFTLPATPKQDLSFSFFSGADQNMVVSSGTDNMIVVNDIAADSVALSTTSQKAGGGFKVIGTGSKWIVIPMVFPSQTVTVAT